MTIIVTGGAGFIGSHLCERLVTLKNKVICVDNFVTGSIANIERLLTKPNFFLIKHDITQPLRLREKIDQIYNLASPASPVKYQEKPIETLQTNVYGVYNMLKIAKLHQARFLQASTSEIYGNPLKHPQRETYWGNVNPVGPRSCYDEGKRCAEALTIDFQREYKVDTRIARIFNTYGPRMAIDDGRVVSNFITQALRQEPITIYGDGSQTRSFCYVTDMVNGLIKLMAAKYNQPVNLGNPEEKTIQQLAEIIIQLTDSKSKIVYKNLPPDDPRRRRPSISLAKRILKWQPKVNLNQGLRKTIRFFKKRYIKQEKQKLSVKQI